ncbi:hypothetical protein AOLI_G00306410 [Acnodon oligacanthus]
MSLCTCIGGTHNSLRAVTVCGITVVDVKGLCDVTGDTGLRDVNGATGLPLPDVPSSDLARLPSMLPWYTSKSQRMPEDPVLIHSLKPHGWGLPRIYCFMPLNFPLNGTIISSTELCSSGTTSRQFSLKEAVRGLTGINMYPQFISALNRLKTPGK